jgi:hypothetical protein
MLWKMYDACIDKNDYREKIGKKLLIEKLRGLYWGKILFDGPLLFLLKE